MLEGEAGSSVLEGLRRGISLSVTQTSMMSSEWQCSIAQNNQEGWDWRRSGGNAMKRGRILPLPDRGQEEGGEGQRGSGNGVRTK
jgi:hypothetical protein